MGSYSIGLDVCKLVQKITNTKYRVSHFALQINIKKFNIRKNLIITNSYNGLGVFLRSHRPLQRKGGLLIAVP